MQQLTTLRAVFTRKRMLEAALLGVIFGAASILAQEPGPVTSAPRDLFVTAGKSLLVDSPVDIERISVADSKVAQAVVTTPKEIVVNGKAPGATSLIIWQRGAARLMFDLKVSAAPANLDALRHQLARELEGQNVNVENNGGFLYLRGTVNDLTSANRAIEIANTFGKPVNLLRVKVGAAEAQILLHVKFATIDRSTSLQLGANIFSTGATNTLGSTSTQQYSPPNVSQQLNTINPGTRRFTTQSTVSNALNLFLFRPDLNLGATIEALQNRNLAEILAEPNVLAMNGKPASFLAGGEFPYPTLQGGGAGLGAVTIVFREFGVRINFVPTITPRGTIQLDVAPEVSSLDFASGLVYNGFTIPALATRRAHTNIELQSGQSFAIGGLLDNRLTKELNKIPGLANIPLLGKLFQSESFRKNNSELLIVVTPELVRPIPADMKPPSIAMDLPFTKAGDKNETRTPPMSVTGPVPVVPAQESVPVEQLLQQQQQQGAAQSQVGGQSQPSLQFVPLLVPPQATGAGAAPASTTPAVAPMPEGTPAPTQPPVTTPAAPATSAPPARDGA